MEMPKELLFPEPGRVVFAEAPLQPLGPNSVRIQTRMTGVCHSGDYRALIPSLPADTRRYPWSPITWGSGEIVEMRGDSIPFRVGDRIHGPMRHAEYQVLPVDNVYPLQWMKEEFSVCIHPGIYALRMVRTARIRFGDHVAIIGMGATGLLALQYVLACGAGAVLSVDRLEDRLQVATRLGSSHAFASQDKPMATDWRGWADVTLVLSGDESGLDTALAVTKPTGEIVTKHDAQTGASGPFTLSPQENEKTIKFLEHSTDTRSVRELTELTIHSIQTKKVIVWPLVSDFTSFDQAMKFYEKLRMNPFFCLKGIFCYKQE